MIRLNFNALVQDVRRSNARAICTCKHCGLDYKPKAVDRTTYCSRQCYFEAKAASKAAKMSAIHVATRQCKGCGDEFVANRGNQVYCCDSCRPSFKSVHVSILPASKTCKFCGSSYKPVSIGGAPSGYCCIVCKESAAKACKRTGKAKRKAVLKGATIERVDPFKVFDRDKWRCRLCGVRTPKCKRGTYSDNAPELDHILPLAKGGSHSYINTQCSCRKCNGLKSDAPRGQMLMFG